MLGRRITISSLFLLTSLSAQTYWPINPGNVWIYRLDGRQGETIVLETTDEITVGGQRYTRLTGLSSGDVLLRYDGDRLLALDPATNREGAWYSFGAAVGEAFPTQLPGAPATAAVESRATRFRAAWGTFANALSISYGTGQPLRRELFLPGIGLVSREAGQDSFQLVYASLNGAVTTIAEPQRSFTLAAHQRIRRSAGDQVTGLLPEPMIDVRLTLRNTQPEPLVLQFPSGQRFELYLYDDRGERIATWSADKLFIQATATLEVKGEKTWLADFRFDPSLLRPGRYVVEGFLTTSEGPVWHAFAPLEITSLLSGAH